MKQWKITLINPAKKTRVVYKPKGLHEAEATRNAYIDANKKGGYWRVISIEIDAVCEYCDGTGDVNTIDGEYRGPCNCGALSQFSSAMAK